MKFHSQAAITSFVAKKHVVFEQLDLNFKLQKNELIDSKNERVLLCLRRSMHSPQEIHVRCVEIDCQKLSRTDVGSNPVKLYFRSNVGVP